MCLRGFADSASTQPHKTVRNENDHSAWGRALSTCGAVEAIVTRRVGLELTGPHAMTTIVDVAIGVSFLYLLLSLLVTTGQELLASVMRTRAKTLYASIADMLGGPGLAKELYEHPLLRNLSDRVPRLNHLGMPGWVGRGLPSYIPAKTFALALIDVLRSKETASQALGISNVLSRADEVAAQLPDAHPLKRTLNLLLGDLKTLSDATDERATAASERLENWFNERMARTSGWYKRNARAWSLGLAFGVAVTANADSIYYVQRLWDDGQLRSAVVASASTYYDTHPATENKLDGSEATVSENAARLRAEVVELRELNLPLGWQFTNGALCARKLPADKASPTKGGTPPESGCWKPTPCERGLLGVGWMITALAISLGSGFWFQLLGNILQLRSTGPRIPTEPTAKEPTKAA